MSEPTPAQLRAYAQELRELATAQDGRAGSCHTLLDGVTRLDDTTTWSGDFADQTHTTFTGWGTALTTAAADCREQARSWRSLAHDLDERADHLAAKQKSQGTGG